jgi:hypothetical protein
LSTPPVAVVTHCRFTQTYPEDGDGGDGGGGGGGDGGLGVRVVRLERAASHCV